MPTTASAALVLGAFPGRALARHGNSAAGRILNLVLLAAVALPSVLLASGRVLTYNLPLAPQFGINLIVGDDWRGALAVMPALAATYGLVRGGVDARWLPPTAVLLLLGLSRRRVVRAARQG
ncbi:hypothetical protein ACEZCY_27045 [Streptacidiphilus sp. N1-12]|uniref:Uncharacterized protein n=2 Tax=Streptacidiphilus alkalitolerans TaxID=3342712 RepID=A0ABV6WM76_9ACTN